MKYTKDHTVRSTGMQRAGAALAVLLYMPSVAYDGSCRWGKGLREFLYGVPTEGPEGRTQKGGGGALVGSLCRFSGRGKATGRERGEFTGDLMVPQGAYRELEEAHQGTLLGKG